MKHNERYAMIVTEVEENLVEVSIIDTEEENVELFCIACETSDLFFCKQDIESLARAMNWQDDYIKELVEENRKLKKELNR